MLSRQQANLTRQLSDKAVMGTAVQVPQARLPGLELPPAPIAGREEQAQGGRTHGMRCLMHSHVTIQVRLTRSHHPSYLHQFS